MKDPHGFWWALPFPAALLAVLVAVFVSGCASAPKLSPAKAASDAHKYSVDACKAYHAAVALGAPSDARADAACEAAQGLCSE